MKKILLAISIVFAILFLSFMDNVNSNNTEKITLTASYYSNYFNGRVCANGTRFSNNKLTAASNIYPLNTLVKVTNLLTGDFVIVKITDRIHKRFNNKRIDLSKKAFASIGNIKNGLLNVLVEEFKEEQDNLINTTEI